MCINTNVRITPFMKQCFITLGVDLTMICFGSALGFPAILLPQLNDPDSSVNPTKDAQSWIASVFALGMLCGYFLVPPIMDRLGRKKAHILVTVIYIIGWITAALAADATVLIVGRVLHGIASGMLSPLATVLVAECSSPKNRGAFITTITLSQSSGILLVHSLGSVLSWRNTSLVCMFFPFISLIMTIYTPESPSWYLSKGKYEKFKEVFRWYRGNVEEEELTSMLRSKKINKPEAEETEKVNNNCCGNLKDEVTKREFYKPLIIMIHSTNILHFAGGTLLITYSTVIINILMGPGSNFYFWTVFMDVLRLCSSFVAIFVIYRFKRRFVVLISGTLCVFAHAVLASYLYGTSWGWLRMTPWIPIVFISLQLFANAVGIVPLRSVIGGELFPLKYRSIGGSISSASGSMFMFIVLKSFPYLVDLVKLQGTYVVNGSIVLYNLFILFMLLPETKGRTLIQIEEDFKRKETKEKPEDIVIA